MLYVTVGAAMVASSSLKSRQKHRDSTSINLQGMRRPLKLQLVVQDRSAVDQRITANPALQLSNLPRLLCCTP